MIDTRDLYDELENLRNRSLDPESDDEVLTDEENARLAALETLAQDIGESILSDGEAMIPEVDFPDYARDLAEDVTPMFADISTQWPFSCIDWDYAARELSHDYTLVTFDGTDYYVRSN